MEYVQPIRDMEMVETIQSYLKERNERDYVLFMVGITTGLRISDILQLKVGDVQGTHIRRKEIKTGKGRRTPISPELRKALSPYVKDKLDDEWLFLSRQKGREGNIKPIDRSTAYRIIKEAARKAGFRDNCGTHTMRKTFGYMHYKKWGNVAALQKIFNHDTELVTFAYIGLEDDFLDKTIMGLYR
ncbi:site-specific integrase [Peribacillus muralis]|uniref:site-specific integrase n=1 Tax=Peribacillus muralis TaxID=264697 RepID=UPI003D06FAE6